MKLLLMLLLAMSDSKAMTTATAMFDSVAMIASIRGVTDGNWTRQVGVQSLGCKDNFTVLGSGFNIWDAAFQAISPTAVSGPFSGIVHLRAQAWDNNIVAGVTFRLDGQPLPEVTMPVAQSWTVDMPYDLSTIPEGTHTLCPTARDGAGNIGRGNVFVFEVSHTLPTISDSIGPIFPPR